MNFNFGEVLTRAGQITWKHKVLWISGIIIGLIGILPASISMIFMEPFSSFAVSDPAQMNQNMLPILLVNALTLFLSILSIPVYVIGMTIPSLGTIRSEKGIGKISFGELTRDSLPYFWRILGIMALVGIGMFVFVMVFTACIGALSVVTLGLGALCAFPFLLLFIPIAILVYSLMEQGMSAVLVDNLGLSDALRRAWDLVKKNLGGMALLSIIIYFGSVIVGMIISVPMMIPMFGVISKMSAGPDLQAFDGMFRSMTWWMLAFSPLYALFQGLLLTFTQSTWTLTYMRLTRKPETNNDPRPESGMPLIPEDSDKTIIARPNA